MKSNLMKAAAAIALGSLTTAALSLYYIYHSEQSQFIGKLVFAEANHPDNQPKEIIISRPNQTITLTSEGNFWQVKEADNYYAAFDIMRLLHQNIAEARFLAHEPENGFLSGNDETTIKIIGENGRELNRLTVTPPDNENKKWRARLPAEEGIFTVSGNYNFPTGLNGWTRQPLLTVETKNIQSINDGKEKVSRNDPSQAFIIYKNNQLNRIVRLDDIERQILYLTYDKVMSAQNFDDTRYPHCRDLSFSLFSGLVYNMDICTDNHEYWLKLTLSTTPLPTSETNDYIRYNAFLYDGWFFKLPEKTGRLLYQYHL